MLRKSSSLELERRFDALYLQALASRARNTTQMMQSTEEMDDETSKGFGRISRISECTLSAGPAEYIEFNGEHESQKHG